jgi:hypothetical protein
MEAPLKKEIRIKRLFKTYEDYGVIRYGEMKATRKCPWTTDEKSQ